MLLKNNFRTNVDFKMTCRFSSHCFVHKTTQFVEIFYIYVLFPAGHRMFFVVFSQRHISTSFILVLMDRSGQCVSVMLNVLWYLFKGHCGNCFRSDHSSVLLLLYSCVNTKSSASHTCTHTLTRPSILQLIKSRSINQQCCSWCR